MARAWHLTSRPQGLPSQENFALREIELPPLGPGMVGVRNLFISVDPYMRGRMNDVKSYVPPFQVGAPLEGGAVGVVVASNAAEVGPGDTVLHGLGWRVRRRRRERGPPRRPGTRTPVGVPRR